MRKNGIKDFKWIFYRQNLRKLVKIGFLALVGFFFQKKWGTNKIKSVSTYPWNVKWILLFSNFDFHILSPPPTLGHIGHSTYCPKIYQCHDCPAFETFLPYLPVNALIVQCQCKRSGEVHVKRGELTSQLICTDLCLFF